MLLVGAYAVSCTLIESPVSSTTIPDALASIGIALIVGIPFHVLIANLIVTLFFSIPVFLFVSVILISFLCLGRSIPQCQFQSVDELSEGHIFCSAELAFPAEHLHELAVGSLPVEHRLDEFVL